MWHGECFSQVAALDYIGTDPAGHSLLRCGLWCWESRLFELSRELRSHLLKDVARLRPRDDVRLFEGIAFKIVELIHPLELAILNQLVPAGTHGDVAHV